LLCLSGFGGNSDVQPGTERRRRRRRRWLSRSNLVIVVAVVVIVVIVFFCGCVGCEWVDSPGHLLSAWGESAEGGGGASD
jgi:hypothetical protein